MALQSSTTPAVDRPIQLEPSLHFVKLSLASLTYGSALYALVMLFLIPEQHWRFGAVLLLSGLTGTAWLYLRRNKVRTAMWILAVGVWVYATVTSFFLGGPLGPSTVIYPLTILLVGWLAGSRMAVLTAVATSVSIFAMVLLDSVGWLPAIPATPLVLRWIIQSGVWVLTAVLIHSVNQSYRARLEDVRTLHADLDRAQAVAHVGSWTFDFATDRMVLSSETCRIFGVPIGTTGSHRAYVARVHAEDRSRLEQAWERARTGGGKFDDEHRIVVNGVIRWVRQVAEFEFDAAGHPVRSVGTTQDVTDRHEAEERLGLTRIGVEQASEAIFWVRADGTFADCNEAKPRADGEDAALARRLWDETERIVASLPGA